MSRSARTSAGRGCFVALLLLSSAGPASGQDRPCNLPETGTLQAGAGASSTARIRWENFFVTATLLCCMLHSFCTRSPPRAEWDLASSLFLFSRTVPSRGACLGRTVFHCADMMCLGMSGSLPQLQLMMVTTPAQKYKSQAVPGWVPPQ